MRNSYDRAAALAAELVKAEPFFASRRHEIADWLGAPAGAEAEFPPALVAARREATAAIWSSGGAEWNRVAAARLGLLRRFAQDPTLAVALIELFSADFSQRQSTSGLEAAGAVFPGHLILTGAKLGALRLNDARCLGCVFANGVEVAGDLSADQAQFGGPVSFAAMRVGRSARFASATFASEANFDEAVVEREVWLRGARFAGPLRFRRADLRRDASLGCVYEDAASFDHTRFADTVSFEDAIFKGPLSLDFCRFDGIVLTRDAQPLGAVSSRGAAFLRGARPASDWLRRGGSVGDMLAAVQKAMSS